MVIYFTLSLKFICFYFFTSKRFSSLTTSFHWLVFFCFYSDLWNRKLPKTMKFTQTIYLITILSSIYTLCAVNAKPADLKYGKEKSDFGITCSLCEAGVALIKELLKWGVSRATIGSRLQSLCDGLHIENQKVCQGVIHVFSVSQRV